MNHTRSLVVAIMVGLLLAWSVWRAGPSSDAPPPAPLSNPGSTAPGKGSIIPAPASSVPAARFVLDRADDPLAGLVGEGLNAADGSARRDLSIVGGILEAWQTNFPGQGNPVGLNGEITRALTGQNPLRVPFIPEDHPAINPDGELCDRWGTPLIFHQISKYHMELRSAGPDRAVYTEDDLVWNEAEPF